MDISLLPERIRAKITVEGDCWVWTGCVANGYGQVQWQKKRYRPHRLVYTMLVGPIEDGLQLDHLMDQGCTTKLCCFPGHLEPVTNAENMRRYFATITHCPAGHRYDEENTYIHNGCRSCRKCKAERDAESRAAGYVRPSRRKVAA